MTAPIWLLPLTPVTVRRFEQWALPERCGTRSPGGRMACEYPPDHLIGAAGKADHHYGRDRVGRWRSWKMEGEK